jgi:hypothetical protein
MVRKLTKEPEMFAVLRVVLEAELAVEQVLVAIEPDVVHAVGGQD